jgi:hypothetical protein
MPYLDVVLFASFFSWGLCVFDIYDNSRIHCHSNVLSILGDERGTLYGIKVGGCDVCRAIHEIDVNRDKGAILWMRCEIAERFAGGGECLNAEEAEGDHRNGDGGVHFGDYRYKLWKFGDFGRGRVGGEEELSLCEMKGER